MRVLVVGGPPAVGKSTIGRRVASGRPRGAFIDVDDVRQLVVNGAAAPWDGPEGLAQQSLGVMNACALASNFVRHSIDVVVVDVLTAGTVALYRRHLQRPLVVQLAVDYEEAQRRAMTRPVYLTSEEFRMLHEQQAGFTDADEVLDTTMLTPQETAAAIAAAWMLY